MYKIFTIMKPTVTTDLIGGGESSIRDTLVDEEDLQGFESMGPSDWLSHLYAPIEVERKTRLLLYLKSERASVWRVLVQVLYN